MIGSELFSGAASHVKDSEVGKRQIILFPEKFDQIWVVIIVPSWLIVKVGDQIIVNALFRESHLSLLRFF